MISDVSWPKRLVYWNLPKRVLIWPKRKGLEKSEKIKCDGFFTYTTEDRIKNQKILFKNIDNTDINIAAGAEGSILVFQNNIVHKGNLPLKDKRNLISLEVMPSTSEMTDEDLMQRVANFFDVKYHPTKKAQPHHKQAWQLAICKTEIVIEIYFGIYKYMSKRRQAKLDEFANAWNFKGYNVPQVI